MKCARCGETVPTTNPCPVCGKTTHQQAAVEGALTVDLVIAEKLLPYEQRHFHREATATKLGYTVLRRYTDYDKALAALPTAQGQAAPERTAIDYALEHADYLAKGAERFIDAVNGLAWLEQQRDDGEDVTDAALSDAKETLADCARGLRSDVYEFRKRRDRAAVPAAPLPDVPAAHPAQPEGSEG